MDFKTIDKRYRPIPFWSWNEKLTPDETCRQVGIMDDVHIGGFFMHARGGLQTEFMGEEWFRNIGAAIEEAKKRGMHPWAYDENGWPSGFGGGKVNGKGERYQQKYLHYCLIDEEMSVSHEICRDDRYIFYYEVNPFYVDTLDKTVVADFIHEIYEPYYAKFGNDLEGFFTDEPQIARYGMPWSMTLPDAYEKAYGEPIYPHLAELFFEQGDYKKTRMQFWKLVTELFSEHYCKQIHDWCHAHHLQFTGHLTGEEHLTSQIHCSGAEMPHYAYFDMPGMDWLSRDVGYTVTPVQVASAAAQAGRRDILSETFAMCGHNIGLDHLKRNYEWMMVHGINRMCQHLEGYSLRGLRKRDYPPAMYYQQPWWADYTPFNDFLSRIGMLLAKGNVRVDTLVLHNITSGWICFNNRDNGEIGRYDEALASVMKTLDRKHIPFHFGDEIVMERCGRVENREFVIGEMRYRRVVIPDHIAFLPHTEALLAEFQKNGGEIVTADDIPSNPIIDNPDILYTVRDFSNDGFSMHYFVNPTETEQQSNIDCNGFILDAETGEKLPFDGSHTFPPYGSLVVIDDGTPQTPKMPKKTSKIITPEGTWAVQYATENALTLDTCDYTFDGILQQKDGYILNIGPRANALRHPVDIVCDFTVYAEELPENMYLAVETPEIFTITVNGVEISKKDCGYFRDRAFRKLDISGLLHTGENHIKTRTRFCQSDAVYRHLDNAKRFESARNNLTYDMEIESMYLVGDFAVRCDGKFTNLPHDASSFDGRFIITKPKKTVTFSHLEKQGYPFFAGELTLEKTLVLQKGDTDRRLVFDKHGINAIRVQVNGKQVKTLLWAPYDVDLSPYLHEGENRLCVTVVNNLRNLLGPHHHKDGELHAVVPGSFYQEKNDVWTKGPIPFTRAYCFVHTGLEKA